MDRKNGFRLSNPGCVRPPPLSPGPPSPANLDVLLAEQQAVLQQAETQEAAVRAIQGALGLVALALPTAPQSSPWQYAVDAGGEDAGGVPGDRWNGSRVSRRRSRCGIGSNADTLTPRGIQHPRK